MLKEIVAVMALVSADAALAQAAPPSAQHAGGVDEYLCTFAGKCGRSDAAGEASIPAPATKGFRLAAPSAAASSPAASPTASPRLASSGPVASSRPVARVGQLPTRAMHRPPAGTRANLLLTFDYNSDRLTDPAKERARDFATALLSPELKSKRFLIEGHTDSRGTRSANLELSRRRAQSVADFLLAQGVQADRVEVKGYGSDRPLPHQTRSAEANRRVEAVLLS